MHCLLPLPSSATHLIQKLGQVNVVDSPQHQHILSGRSKGALQVASSTQHRHHSPHAVIVVILQKAGCVSNL